MDKDKAIVVASAYFPNYPTVQEFHVTADEQVFESKTFAEAHAATLNKAAPAVFTVSRRDVAENAPAPLKSPGKKK